MFATLSSYIWGSEPEDQTVPDCTVEIREQAENEWVLVDVVNPSGEIDIVKNKGESRAVPRFTEAVPRFTEVLEESWYITPPSCFNASQADSSSLETSPLENLLIEHPSMSVYGPTQALWDDVDDDSRSTGEQTPEDSQNEADRAIEQNGHTHRRVLRVVDKVKMLERRVQKNVLEQAKKQLRKKQLERHNKTQEHTRHSRRKQKKIDRKQGKHSRVYSNRGC